MPDTTLTLVSHDHVRSLLAFWYICTCLTFIDYSIVSEIVSEATNVGRVWKTLFGNTTVVPSIGNNDVYPHNTMYPVPNDVISNLSIAWQQFFAPPDFMSFSKGGYVRQSH
jgi:hypothetical protein